MLIKPSEETVFRLIPRDLDPGVCSGGEGSSRLTSEPGLGWASQTLTGFHEPRQASPASWTRDTCQERETPIPPPPLVYIRPPAHLSLTHLHVLCTQTGLPAGPEGLRSPQGCPTDPHPRGPWSSFPVAWTLLRPDTPARTPSLH